MDAGRLPVFVYGTLRPGEANHGLLRGRTAAETPAVLSGALLYEGPGYPYAVDDPGGGEIHGELIDPLPQVYEAVLADLDRLEEYVPGAPGNLYERVAREVRPTSGRPRSAWVYFAAPATARVLRANGVPIRSGDWRR
ncbi:gamma-glutamylcyclotransferase family protein [Streptantibioticus rubrisoli]|uniref:Gamma-glutamylcyclotransferase n=1 Tax=Streptantibioticus rubrisoli TaxID=1387313 RepID=A0ABT1PE01_9ACTN|nr:gamma-glutamylcyclotransferase family protein [Streptantibioticus rubrisoli]MCQ4043599.1 gamma-glutamylcyclotransferase [Streptantibioticus rubrisoli]